MAARENADRLRTGPTDTVGGILEDLEDQANLAEVFKQATDAALARARELAAAN